MLSYRHAFHAGSFADVLKHAVLVHVLRHAVQKPKPLYYLDTHAGAGSYDLASAMAVKTGEWREGVARVLAAPDPPALVRSYLDLLGAANPAGELRFYPGSPAWARAILRPEDRIELVELHGTDHGLLEEWAGAGALVRRVDGLSALTHRLPPRERRGIALIDPSYEIKSDFRTVVAAVARAHRRFATGVFLLWYPVIDRGRTEELLADLRATGIPRQLRLELCVRPDGAARGMTGAGMLVINPPWTLEEAAATGLPWLARVLEAGDRWTIGWNVPP